ncbi:transcription elongation factor NusA-like protein [Halorubrum californiense DSM 19288]|uniref:Probable transcription termination protein NusA n=1 Tax=Halorubrum californiense DSM 19288 TaxID=1227465 RepID=M0E1F3_9EURY|nr:MULTISPECIES: NusA-like transcription termination signal-binding factor [Halorubrum]ELZ41586.1 transcription elongation factor NusA-like protein [Halorubrum californiense DSM 19288]TKX69789.1 NusA-like transcription termination signal-binding factor [Halorubrum sp. GN11GM_10-3_MGM]
MRVELSDEARRYIGRFDELTGVTPTDCLVEGDRLVFVVPAGKMASAIGQGGETVAEAERRLAKSIELVEDADTAEAFVASALAPAAVNAVTISEQNDRVAYVEIPEADRGVAIGAEGANIETARRLAERHYGIDDVQLT